MIQWVYEGTARSKALSAVYIATCDDEIRDAADQFGAPVIMTSTSHERASDRVAEAAGSLSADVVVMVQGDEPMISPVMIDEAVAPFSDSSVQCTNLMAPIETEDEFRDPNTIKLIVDDAGDALYFSRGAIPHVPAGHYKAGIGWKQVCVIGFRARFLQEYARLAPTPAERQESIDMLRVLEHGQKVRLNSTSSRTFAVDTPADLERVERLMLRIES